MWRPLVSPKETASCFLAEREKKTSTNFLANNRLLNLQKLDPCLRNRNSLRVNNATLYICQCLCVCVYDVFAFQSSDLFFTMEEVVRGRRFVFVWPMIAEVHRIYTLQALDSVILEEMCFICSRKDKY